MEKMLSWTKPTSFDEVESFGVLAGEDNGKKIYVGRAVDKDGVFVPAKVIPALKTGYYVYNGVEEESKEIDFLDNATDYHWVKAQDAKMEEAAVVSGSYIGRGNYNGNLVVGRVDNEKKQLIGSNGGQTFSLPSYDVLIYKSKGVVYETIKKASNFSKVASIRQGSSTTNISFSNDNGFLLSKVRQLEMEKLSYVNDRASFDERVQSQQLKINDLSYQVKHLRVVNSQITNELANYEEKYNSEHGKQAELEQKLNDFSYSNSYLLKKVTSLEEAIRYEKLMVESASEKFVSSDSYCKSLLTKINNFEETTKIQQTRIFELESEISMSSSNSEILLKRVADYEGVIKDLRLQLETFIKKLEISKTDNEFLIQKLSMLSQTLRSYQSQIECLNIKVQESKTIIASAHADLSRANMQIAKYQSAISSCYVMNGELMSKVSSMNLAAQNQTGGDCAHNLVNYTSNIQTVKSIGYGSTAMMFELTGSDSFANVDKKLEAFTPYTTESFTPFAPEAFTPYAPLEEEPQRNGFTDNATAF